MSDSPRRAAEKLSLDLQPVTKNPAFLSLSLRPQTRKAAEAERRLSGPDTGRNSSRRVPLVRHRIGLDGIGAVGPERQ